MAFEPIAIVGRGCVLPGCLTPDALWQAVAEKRSLITLPAPGLWGISDHDQAEGVPKGGFVTGFSQVFDPARPELAALDAAALDPVAQWLLHAGGEAWREAGIKDAAADRIAVIIGNLSYPSRGLSDLAADVWLGRDSKHDKRNRFNSGYPAQVLARSVGASGPAFALDAACASSLYAIKLACDRLHDRSVDVALAGAVQAADSLIINRGFAALQALSPTGRTRPLVEGADGLVPAEGAAAIVLKRLSDVTSGECVYGVIRSVGLSNDGARRGLLVPDRAGQVEAMRDAYALAELDPARDVSLVECHATGTPTGDGTELLATSDVFADAGGLPVGSLKSNIGHLITVAGMGSLLKLISAMAHKTLPPTLIDGVPSSVFDGLPLHPQIEAEPWKTRGPRRAGLSNFGFGGNNAHLILEEYRKPRKTSASAQTATRVKRPAPVVICGIGMNAGPDRGVAAIMRRLMRGRGNPAGPAEELIANPLSAKMPPLDMARTQAQQLAVLDVAEEALSGVKLPGANRIGCFVGMGCDPDATRLMLSNRLAELLGPDTDPSEIERLRAQIADPINSADTLGAMPNLPANRLNASKDWRGMGFTVSAEELSGIAALELACRAVGKGELDMALVAAADFSACEVHEAALAELGVEMASGDGAVALIIKRKKDAKRDGETVLAQVGEIRLQASPGDEAATQLSLIDRIYGRAHAASALMQVAVTALLGARRLVAGVKAPAPWLTDVKTPKLTVDTTSFTGAAARVRLAFDDALPAPDAVRPVPLMEYYAAESATDLIARIDRNRLGGEGDCRLALMAYAPEDMAAKRVAMRNLLARGERPGGEGVFYGDAAPGGELAFVFTGAAAAYGRMGIGLFGAFPEIGETLADRHDVAAKIAPLLATPLDDPFDQLRSMTLLCQAHVTLLREVLGVEPEVSIGLSAGETNAMIAFRAWRDPGALLAGMEKSGAYETHIGGAFEALGEDSISGWANWLMLAPLKDVKREVKKWPLVDITIIYDDGQCLIGGSPFECIEVAKAFGTGQAIRSNQDLIVHTPAMRPFETTWRKLHSRKTYPVKGVRFYTNAGNRVFDLSRANIADTLTEQAVSQIDFPKTIRQAYKNGVRTFVEIGPRSMLTRSIAKILAKKPHLAVAADRMDRADIDQIVTLSAALYASGRTVRMDVLAARLKELARTRCAPREARASDIALPAHRIMPDLSPRQVTPVGTSSAQTKALMPPAPARPSLAAPSAQPIQSEPRPSAPLQSPARATQTLRPELIVPPAREPTGPNFDYEALKAAATGKISKLFGPEFTQQDKYARQVRMPMPPLLLTQRITGIDAKPGIATKGTIWTESDVEADAWYVHADRMRPGPLIEAGQADLLLISYMGADFLNQNERVYRLLGCELTFHPGGPPRVGDTLCYDIRINGHAEVGGIRMFFFEYDCRIGERLLLSVRNGQAGFFSDAELAASKGVQWDAAEAGPPTKDAAPIDASRASAKRAFSAGDVEAFRNGDAYACFGRGFERAATHSFPVVIPGGKLSLFDEVEAFDPAGGPWGRGYMRTRHHVSEDAWFYKGHFHNDPCMPGTLMAEAAVQALEFYAAAMGMTLERDGFVFEPAEDAPAQFLCRGQVIPDDEHDVIYEIYIDEIIDGESPVLFASLLASSGGLKVFQCARFGVTLRRNWNKTHAASHDPDWQIEGPTNDVPGDQHALLVCANGQPTHAFGKMFESFDHEGQSPRLPQDPYHAMSRVISVSEAPGERKSGTVIVSEYDPPDDAWYFTDSANGTMPWAFLLEVALQPCGWLASYSGFTLSGRTFFRNLDGEGVLKREIRPGDGPIRVEATLTRSSTIGPMTIVFFDVLVTLGGEEVFTFSTSFGFFPGEALANQAGLKATKVEQAIMHIAPENVRKVRGGAKLPVGQMQMIDGLDYYDPKGGAAGLGIARGSQEIDPHAWYFKAHFFQDPVQPGSLGIDAMAQVMASVACLKGLGKSYAARRTEMLATGRNVKWTCRGQVTPDKRHVSTLVEITAIEEDENSVTLMADGSLWADGMKIYSAPGLSIRIVDDEG